MRGLLEAPELGRPHLVLADAGDEDHVVGCRITQLLDDELRLDRRAVTGVVGVREPRPPLRELRPPRGEPRLVERFALPQRLDERLDRGRRQSAMTATSGRRTLPISAGSMST